MKISDETFIIMTFPPWNAMKTRIFLYLHGLETQEISHGVERGIPRQTETLTSALVTGSGSKRCLTRPDHFLQQRMDFWTAQKGFNEVTKSQNHKIRWRCVSYVLDCPKACIQGVCCSIFHVGPMTWPRTTERLGADQSTSRVKHLNLPEALSRHCK